jgi:hypothetical protein
VGQPLGPRPPGVAHRMQRDDTRGDGPADRRARRRARPGVPAPRERAGAVAGGRGAVGWGLAGFAAGAGGRQPPARGRRAQDSRASGAHRRRRPPSPPPPPLPNPHSHPPQAAAGCCDGPHLHDGTDFVRLWMHNGFVNVDSEKMSKSLGNFFTIRWELHAVPPEGPAARQLCCALSGRAPRGRNLQPVCALRAAALSSAPSRPPTPRPPGSPRSPPPLPHPGTCCAPTTPSPSDGSSSRPTTARPSTTRSAHWTRPRTGCTT